jgi:hypothetical protein
VSSSERKRPKFDSYYEGEPHPLPLTRRWVEDYKRWAAEGYPTPVEEAARKATSTGPPDLQELVERAGGYQHITPEEWAEYDRAMAAWQRWRRAGL